MEKYKTLWEARYHATWTPNNTNVMETLEILKPAIPGFDPYSQKDLLARLDVFFRCKEDWLVSCKHSYSTFLKHIPRWAPSQPTQTTSPPHLRGGEKEGVNFCPECSTQLHTPGEICNHCFPVCYVCGCQHSTKETCTEFAERDRRLRQMFSKNSPRGNQVTDLIGKPVISLKEVKGLREEARSNL